VLIPKLAGGYSEVCSAAAQALDALGWLPQTPAEKVAYLIAKNDFDETYDLGD
jgi:hypothetical protein